MVRLISLVLGVVPSPDRQRAGVLTFRTRLSVEALDGRIVPDGNGGADPPATPPPIPGMPPPLDPNDVFQYEGANYLAYQQQVADALAAAERQYDRCRPIISAITDVLHRREVLQEALDAEMAKPEGQRDQTKIAQLQASIGQCGWRNYSLRLQLFEEYKAYVRLYEAYATMNGRLVNSYNILSQRYGELWTDQVSLPGVLAEQHDIVYVPLARPRGLPCVKAFSSVVWFLWASLS